MASKGAVLPLLRRELRPAASRFSRASFSSAAAPLRSSRSSVLASGRRTTRQAALFTPSRTLGQFRCFSQSLSNKLTDEDGHFDPRQVERESDEVDVCIVGGGPAGLASAIRLKQLANEAGNEEFRVIVLEKAGEIGAHILSGNVLEPTAINELLPDWLSEDNPSRFEGATPAKGDKMRFLTKNSAIPIPAPPQMNNHGNYIISLNELTKWLGERAEELGVEIYPGFAASELVYKPDGSVLGVATNDLGIGRDGKAKESFERGMEFHARITLLAEGCHGSLTKQVIKKYDLRRDSQPQTYGIGLKEVWEIQPEKFKSGEIIHSMGYPLPKDTYGGSWLYHFGDNMVSIGMVVGLDYPNPWLSPYGEFQKLKHHPLFKEVLEGGKCISYGARALNEGGFQSIPKCAFPGGALIGDTAGFLNVPKIKGTHTAMKSGMLAAESAFSALQGKADDATVFLFDYEDALRKSSIWKELYEVRNMRPSFSTPLGLYGGIMYSGLEAYLFKGRTPWTLKHHGTDAAATKQASECEKIEYPKPDGVISFDILTSVSRTGTNHEEDQPVHLQVADWDKHKDIAWPKYKGVENRFCPAGVYEYVEDSTKEHGVRFQINAQNCIHCKTCDIKVPTQDINWQTPQGDNFVLFDCNELTFSRGALRGRHGRSSVTKQDIEEHFSTHGSGKITEIKLMNGFGFIEYEDAMDARDVVPAFHGSDFKGERLTVQFARGPRRKENFPGPMDRPNMPRPRRTAYRMMVSGLPETSWQDLKDFARGAGLDVVYSETGRELGRGFVEFETANDLKTAIEKLDGRDFKGSRVSCVADIQPVDERPFHEYDRRFPPPRGYSPRAHYRERSPIPMRRDYYDRDGYGRRTPPRPRIDDYPPPRRPYEDPYDVRPPPPPPRYEDPYMPPRPYGRPRSPPRGEYVPYDRRGYW
ncbi:hypothetical protein ANOM_010498 [Aspergillus nomiae NRRL 13137]|uniref:Probable electron transfer flavoprotein-ubiquinone oxidoreductase, mitochondrial n=1 Tax=Aspergillus nomiae NRRL (strain ATCC 15546 / NRRL 13137 / CBS 260.88 / M93) TaxID=1509407 RepID=A0A0L1IPK9_ASPN3|nr:uncharacterized protein ANOM_010498 [Aspergillus nomiae NRRL 13137]KNG81481.1 hypothetical protein ANOM_010498 [Aspergillus nomiae NRRL 13137]